MDRRVLVIGSGVAGVSTCLHISEKCTTTQLSLVSHHSPIAASDDHSKIVRIDYANEARMREAQLAQNGWVQGSFVSYYTSCGRVVAYDEDSQTLKGIDQSRERLGLQARRRGNKDFFDLFFGPSSAPSTLTFVHNPDDAIVDWQPCMKKHQQKAEDACLQTGGLVYKMELDALQHDGKRVTDAVLANGDSIDTRDQDIVLAVGSWTIQVLTRSGIQLPPQHRIPVPTGLFAFSLELNDEQVNFFRNTPIFSHVGRAEFLPPTGTNRKAKITWVEPFTISPIRDVSTSALAHRALANAVGWARQMLPRLAGAKVTAIRFYCDGVTGTQAPLIARHPVIENLILACGGSYTRAKDLPTDGAYVTGLLLGVAGPERFSWNGLASSEGDHPHLVGHADFESLEAQAKEDSSNLVAFPPGILGVI